MIRSITLAACALALSFATAGAEEARGEKGAGAAEGARHEQGLESIADEAAEVGEYGSEADGMSRVESEMNEAEAMDGCTGSIGNEDASGCGGILQD